MDLDSVQRYLGVEFHRSPSGIFLTQKEYILSMLQEFGMQDSRIKHIPLPSGTVLLSNIDSPFVDPHEYCRIVGKLIFLTMTRPDLAYAVSFVSQYMSQPQ
jgi:hypothetical protein